MKIIDLENLDDDVNDEIKARDFEKLKEEGVAGDAGADAGQ